MPLQYQFSLVLVMCNYLDISVYQDVIGLIKIKIRSRSIYLDIIVNLHNTRSRNNCTSPTSLACC